MKELKNCSETAQNKNSVIIPQTFAPTLELNGRHSGEILGRNSNRDGFRDKFRSNCFLRRYFDPEIFT